MAVKQPKIDPAVARARRPLLEALLSLKSAGVEPDAEHRSRIVRTAAQQAGRAAAPLGRLPAVIHDLLDEDDEEELAAGVRAIQRARQRYIVKVVDALNRWEAEQYAEDQRTADVALTGTRSSATRSARTRRDQVEAGEAEIVFPSLSQPSLGWRLQLQAKPVDGAYTLYARLHNLRLVPDRDFAERSWEAHFSLAGEPRTAHWIPGFWVLDEAVSHGDLGRVTVTVERRLAEELAGLEQAIASCRQEIADGRTVLSWKLARALGDSGNTLVDLGQLDEAEARYHEAIALWRELVENGRAERLGDLAVALRNRGVVLAALAQTANALASFDEAIALWRQLAEGRLEFGQSLAGVLLSRASALKELARIDDARDTYDEAIALLQQSIEEGRIESRSSLPFALHERALLSGGSASVP